MVTPHGVQEVARSIRHGSPYYPALALYMCFIWLELFGHTTPQTMGLTLVGYTLLNFVAAALFSAGAWFRYGEYFAVFFRLLGKISPLAYARSPEPGSKITVRLRRPFIGLIGRNGGSSGVFCFSCCLSLSSTAFDGMHETLHLGAGVLEVRLSRFNLGHRPAV